MKKTTLSNRATINKSIVSQTKRNSVSKSVTNLAKKSLRSILLSSTLHKDVRLAIIGALIFAPFYGAYAYIGKTVANEVVISKSQILERVATHTNLPAGNPEAVVRVQDAESLKSQNSFYNNIKSGDYIIMYKSLAVIYDLRNDQVLATKNINEIVSVR